MNKIYIWCVYFFVLINNLILNPNVIRAFASFRSKVSESAVVIREVIRWLIRRDAALIRKIREIPRLVLMVIMEGVELAPEIINVLKSFFMITPYQ